MDEAASGDCTPHPPIEITEDEGPQGFILGHEPATGKPIYRPGSGVVDGTGTADDPYVIEGWCITPTPSPEDHISDDLVRSTGILIQGTSAHVVVQNNLIDGEVPEPPEDPETCRSPIHHVFCPPTSDSFDQRNGVRLQSVENITLRDNVIQENDGDGLALTEVGDVLVQGNQISENGDGIVASTNPYVYGPGFLDLLPGTPEPETTGGVRIEDNVLTGNGIDVHTPGAVLVNNTITEARPAIFLDAGDATMEDNELGSGGLRLTFLGSLGDYQHSIDTSNTVNGEPIRYVRDATGVDVAKPAGQVLLVNTTGALVEDLSLSQTPVGIRTAYTENTTIAHVDLHGNSLSGIVMENAVGTRIHNSTISDNDGLGIGFLGARDASVSNNNIAGNADPDDPDGEATGLFATDSDIDARQNWWGAADGPSGSYVTDACTGTPANGTGDAIDGSNVCFDPWLTSPNPNAGAG